MRAIKLKAQVTQDRMLHLELPDDVAQGPADVIVLVGSETEYAQAPSVAEFLDTQAVDPRYVRTREAIDRDLAAERNAWD
ncbi:MAG: hypothetical protein AAGN66_11030 [Acidobacteriota bacterium]